MKIIIAGDGKMGAALTRQLSAEGYDITLIDLNQKVLEEAVNSYDVIAVQGNCASAEILEEANIHSADLLLAVTGADELNLLCCMTAHQLNGTLHTIARIRNPEYRVQIYNMRDVFGLSLAVNPDMQAAVEIERLLRYPGFLRRDSFAKNRVEIVELRVNANSVLKDQSLMNLTKVAGCKVLVCAVLRKGTSITPDGSFVFQEGDRVFVTAPTENLSILLKSLGIITRKVKNVMICGGGRISYYLANQLLKQGMGVTIIEKDPDRCKYLAENLENATIIYGDATNQRLLESEGAPQCDALISMTSIDEMNMIISLYGDSCGVPQIITKLNHLENGQMLDNLPLGCVINSKDLCSNTIVRYIRALNNQTGAAVTVHGIADGQAEALEFHIDETSRNCGVAFKDMRLKKDILIVCISRKGQQIIPDGESWYEKGDTVIVVTGRQNFVKSFNDIFEG